MSDYRDDGGPAFPRQHTVADANDPAFKLGADGMSLRDYFAAKAPHDMEWLKQHASGEECIVSGTSWAYAWADGMLAARKR